MKIQSSNKNLFFFEPDRSSGEKSYTCPECSHTRKKSKDKPFSWNADKNSGFCHHCNLTFWEYKPYEPKNYNIPEWKNITSLTDGAVKYMTGRRISQATLKKMGVYSDTEYMPQLEKDEGVICFPYFYGDKIINIKYRTRDKLFKLYSGAELIFYNFNALKDNDSIIITEGEIDCLTFIENGFENVVSVPNGANKNLEYMDSCIDLFNQIDRVYLATDQDTKGIELRDELARRIGAEKCYIISFKHCKDANEYFLELGTDFKELITEAKPYPIKGIINVEDIYIESHDLFVNGVDKGKDICKPEIDKHITWETGRLAIATGTPGAGKSEFVDYIVTRLNLLHGWKAAYFTPENYPLKFHFAKLYEKYIGKKFTIRKSEELEFDMAYEYIRENFFYILQEDDFTVDTVLASAKGLVKSKGIKILIVDPYNKLDHKFTDSETQYVSRFLDRLTSFAKINDVLVFLVAHPRKMNKKADGRFEVPSLYDISGSANFYNKCDYGFTVYRMTDNKNIMINQVEVYWQKIKFKHLGEQGITELKYNYNNGRFEPGTDVTTWDNTNWLVKDNNPFL